VRGVQLGKILLIAAAIESVGLLANAAASLVTDKASGALRWILPLTVALLAAMVKAVIDAFSKQPAPADGSMRGPGEPLPGAATYPPGPYPVGPTPRTTPAVRPKPGRAARSALIAILVVLVACGGGGFVVTAGVRYAVSWVTGREDGTDRLVEPVSGRAGALGVTVERVVYTAHFTRVDLVVRNEGSAAASLPLFGNCVFAGSDGTTLEADAFRSQWSETVPPGGTQRGTVTFGGKLPDGVVRASLSFSHVFGPGGGAIIVRTITLRSG
jgi:hypothetical protein